MSGIARICQRFRADGGDIRNMVLLEFIYHSVDATLYARGCRASLSFVQAQLGHMPWGFYIVMDVRLEKVPFLQFLRIYLIVQG